MIIFPGSRSSRVTADDVWCICNWKYQYGWCKPQNIKHLHVIKRSAFWISYTNQVLAGFCYVIDLGAWKCGVVNPHSPDLLVELPHFLTTRSYWWCVFSGSTWSLALINPDVCTLYHGYAYRFSAPIRRLHNSVEIWRREWTTDAAVLVTTLDRWD